MKLNFDPNDAADKAEIPQGVYDFKINNIQERVFGTGTEGITATLDVFLEDQGRIIKVYENLYYTKKALWRIRELCKCVSVDWPEDGLDSDDLLGKSGTAFFGRKKGEKFLNLMEFIKPSTSDSSKKLPPSVVDDDVPF